MTLDITPSGQSCGATVRGVDLGAPLSDAAIAEVRAAWTEHQVLSFPDQQLSHADLERWTLHFGPFGVDPFIASVDTHEHVIAVHRAAEETASIFADVWHADWSFQAQPPDGTCLHAKIVPPVGGETDFVNQYAALAAMPSDLRDRIEGRRAIHSARFGYSPTGMYGEGDDPDARAMNIISSDEAYDTQLHSIIKVHPESGRETLYGCLGYMIGIEGMDDAEGRELLSELYAWQTREEFQYHHRWEPNMLLMWDNRCVLHKANGGYDGHERLLHRTTIGHNAAVAS